MAYVAHETALDRRNPDGVSLRAVYQEKARRGDASATTVLVGPEYPYELQYLYDWSVQLVGRSGSGQFGPAPLAYPTIEVWSRLTGNLPTEDDIPALIRIDGAWLGLMVDDEPDDDASVAEPRTWGKKKVSHG